MFKKMNNEVPDEQKPMIALTFDDGPTRNDRRILAALERAGGRATFFMLGKKVERYGSTIERIMADGCEIGNHSWDHPRLDRLPAEEIRDQIGRTNDVISRFTGQAPALVRPPYGETGGSVLPVFAEMGYPAVLWSIDTLDWKTKNTVNTLAVVLHHASDGDIILMHSMLVTAVAVELMAPALVRRGFRLVTVSELLAARGGMAPGRELIKLPPRPAAAR